MGLFGSLIPIAGKWAEDQGYDLLPDISKQNKKASNEWDKFKNSYFDDWTSMFDPRKVVNPDYNPLAPNAYFPSIGWSEVFDKSDPSNPAPSNSPGQPNAPQIEGYGGGEEGGGMDSFSLYLDKLNAIANSPLATKDASFDQTYIDAERAKIRDYIDGIRTGRIQPEVTSPEMRQNLINKAEGTFGRQLALSNESALAELNKRGMLPSTSTGFSGPATDVLMANRAKYYEDPLTSFTRDLDIQTEGDRVKRLQALNDTATSLEERLLQSGETVEQFKSNLALQNLASKRGFVGGLFGNITSADSAAAQRDLEAAIANMNSQNEALNRQSTEKMAAEGNDLKKWLAEEEAKNNANNSFWTGVGGTDWSNLFQNVNSNNANATTLNRINNLNTLNNTNNNFSDLTKLNQGIKYNPFSGTYKYGGL